MYRAMDKAARAAGIASINDSLYGLEKLAASARGAPWLLPGDKPSIADASIFPHFVFITYMLPRFFGWPDVFSGRPRLAEWWAAVQRDPLAAKVRACVPENESAAAPSNCPRRARWICIA